MVTWNDDQKRAIYTKDKNILISASAGAGKTSVLIARLMHLIEDEHIGVDEILAMTFSEAAANEMKKRLASSLHESLLSGEESPFLKKQLANLDSANISTIHGFCLNIIKEYYYMIQLDKKRINNPMDDAQAQQVRKVALDQALEIAYQDEHFFHLSQNFTSRVEHDGSLHSDIKALANLANSKADPYIFLDSCLSNYQKIQNLSDIKSEVKTYFFEFFQVQTNLLISLVAQAIEDMHDELLLPKKERYEQALLKLVEFDYEQFRLYFMNAIKVKLPPDSKCSFSKEIADKEKLVLKQLFDKQTFIDNHNANIDDLTLFIKITSDYLHFYEAMKINEQVIDFDDMEHYAIQILKAQDGYVAKQYQEKFKAIMVDEFQDSNDVQDELVRLICKENNVFRVGDIKQSIYGFRHALPAIMKALMKETGRFDELIFLRHNYRSSKMIVDFNNELFDKLMNIEGIDSSYLEADNVETGIPSQELIKHPVTMHLINSKLVDPEKEYTSAELKAQYLANQIQAFKQKGYRYKDMVVLVRSNAKMVEIKDVLDEYQIPCFYNKKQGFYDSKSVASVLSYLKALMNPHDDLNFVSILTSVLFEKDVNDLAKAKLSKIDKESFYQVLKDEDYLGTFHYLLANLDTLRLSEILEVIYNTNNFYTEYVDSQERANLDLLFEMVCSYESKEAMSIQGFLRFLKNQRDVEVAEAMPIGINDDVVKIMSIHKSKGLQFKVVFLYSSSSFSSKDSDGSLSFDEQLGIGMKYLDSEFLSVYPTITSIALKQKKLKEYLEEELRLLYVATTRAQEELHLIDVGEDSNVVTYDINEFYKLKGYTNWVRKAFVNTNTELFEYCHVEEMWETPVNEKMSSVYEYKTYQFESKPVEMISPSDSEIKLHKPNKFTLLSDSGFERGSNLHKMVEVLPPMNWNEDVIVELAHKKHIELDQHDVEVLLKLGMNEIFKQCHTYKNIYHEFAFMAKKEEDILHGYMDFLAVDDTSVIMIDFKSDRGVDDAVLIERYQEQIQAYRYALLKLYPDADIRTYLYGFEKGNLIEVSESEV